MSLGFCVCLFLCLFVVVVFIISKDSCRGQKVLTCFESNRRSQGFLQGEAGRNLLVAATQVTTIQLRAGEGGSFGLLYFESKIYIYFLTFIFGYFSFA